MNLKFNWIPPSFLQHQPSIAESEARSALTNSPLAANHKPLKVSFLPSGRTGTTLVAIVEELASGRLLATLEFDEKTPWPHLTLMNQQPQHHFALATLL